jgi:hypothetical protein
VKLGVSPNKMVGVVWKDKIYLPQNRGFDQDVVLVAARTEEIDLWGWSGEKHITGRGEELMQDRELLRVVLDFLVEL